MIKSLFFDLDGTLLNSKKEISPRTIATLKKCIDNGIKLFIATARPPFLDKMGTLDDKTLSLFTGGSYYNGGCIVLGDKKTYTAISDDIVQKSISYVCQYDTVNIALQMENEKHAFRYPLDDSGYMTWGISAHEALSLSSIEGLKTVKILVFYSNLADSKTLIDIELVAALENLCIDTAQFYLTDKGTCVQIMARDVTKASSIEKIRASLGFDRDEIVVFGDDANDVEMLRECGIGVAVANAIDEAKAAADHICDANDNDGVAKWLEEYVL